MYSARSTLRSLLASPVVWLLLVLLVGGSFLLEWVRAVGGPEGIHARFGLAAPLVTGSLQLALSPTLFPTDLFCIAHGALYGFWIATLLNWSVWFLASLFQFAMGRRLGSDLELDGQLDRLPLWLRRFPVGHPVFLIGGRLIPWAGGHVTSILPGAMGVSLFRVAWCSALGIVPGAAALAAMGAGVVR